MPPSSQREGPHHVVGIGASAGGLSALERFFDNVPPATGMAFVVVQHLSPDFKSLMDELLARHTELPIHLVEDGMVVEADHVYLIPPRKEMIISGGCLLLSDRDRHQELPLPIDVFFRSLAQDCGPRAVAIVLSGGGSDGSRGIRAIHEAGGLVVVQDLGSAEFDGMPKTARDAGVAHFLLAPQDMPRALIEHAEQRRKVPTARGTTESQGLTAVYRMLESEFGIDFTDYKPSTVTRRIERRLALAHSTDIDEYVDRLRADHDELDVLYRDLLIGVTSFFRDQEAFELLERKVLPELLQSEPRDRPLRLWVAGCATGEEPYSLAIVLQDLMAELGERPVKIFATDVHRGSIDRASRAIYDEEAVANVSPARLERYFQRTGDDFQVVPDVRQMVVFADHNVITDPPFTRMDLISCRNLLIYFQPAAQQKVLSLFHFALNRGGILFLGPSESAGPVGYGFENLDKPWQVYRKQSEVRVPFEARVRASDAGRPSAAALAPPGRYSMSELLATYDTLLAEVMPPSLLVTDRGELVHAFGGASRLLRPRDGRQGLDVLELVHPELRLVLVGGLKRAANESTPIAYRGIRIDDETFRVSIRKVVSRSGVPAHLLVTIEPTEAPPPRPAPRTAEIEVDQVSREQVGALEAELMRVRESLQASNEELQASNEELQAANEELQSSNEELQSTNEELQSVNEELYTVNAEYQRKIDALTELTNDMDNLLASTDVGTVFLGNDLRIRKFTPQIAAAMGLVAHDVGRSIETFAHELRHPELVQDLRRVVADGVPIEREVGPIGGRSWFLRVLAYRKKGAIDGVVLTLIDVTGLKEAEDALFHERYLLNSLLANVPDAIGFKDARGRFIRANTAMAERLGLSDPAAAVGKTALDLPDRETALRMHHQDEAVLRTGVPEIERLERREGPSGDLWDRVTRLPLRDRDSHIVGIITVFRDVTEQMRAEGRSREAVRLRDEFLAMLSHELRNPLGAIVTAIGILRASAQGAEEKTGRLLRMLERQAGQMTRLLDDLLDASRVTQHKIELRNEPVDLRTIARDAAEAVRSQMESRSHRLAVDLGGEPAIVDGDPARLQQIMVNLLNNAAKYTPPGGEVRLQLARDEDEATIRVVDNGVGISRDMLESIFDLFVQSTRTLDRAAGGLGVGLTLVRSLVAMHGGTVRAESAGEGKGTEVVVRLPLSSDLPSIHDPVSSDRPRARIPHAARVVIVEDNTDSRELLCELLGHAGFDCRSAESGPTGLKLIDAFAPNIAIVDVGLPEMDGFEVARRIRSNPKHVDIRLIALTGYGRPSDRLSAHEAGFDEHVVKPVHPDELVRMLDAMRAPDASA